MKVFLVLEYRKIICSSDIGREMLTIYLILNVHQNIYILIKLLSQSEKVYYSKVTPSTMVY